MAKDYLEEYRKKIKEQYEIQKNGNHANFLLKSTEAKLRDLCIILFREKQKKDDLESFKLYFGFEFYLDKTFELNKKETLNKFKTIGKFFTLEGSYFQDINGLDVAAMLVGFENRPYNKFSKLPLREDDKNKKAIDSSSEEEIIEEKKNISSEQENNKEDEKQPIIPILGIIDKPTEISNPVKPQKSSWFNKNIKHVSISAVSLVIVLFGINHLTSEKKCMAWMENHYEEVDCNIINENPNIIVSSKDDNLIEKFRKIIPCDTTKFERNGRVCLWYGKSLESGYDFFTYHGIHPENGKTLKEVTPTIMNKYGKGPCK